jgi:hypothetical protein
VPEDLLIRYSPAFEKMLHGSFKESVERSVELPEDSISVFEDFFVWIYGQTPCISADADLNSLVGLAVFADHYFVHLLQNQISDVMRTKLSDNTWKLTPETMRAVYKETPTGSTLRQLCSLAFTVNSKQTNSWGELMTHDDYNIWKPVFTEFADFGWDYFQYSLEFHNIDTTPTARLSFGLAYPAMPVPILEGGACRFHNHSDVPGWKRTNVSECPYPQGGPVKLPKDDETPELKSPSGAPPKESLAVSTRRSVPWLQKKEQFDAEAEETSKTVNLNEASDVEETFLAPMDDSSVAEAPDNLDFVT